MSVRMESGQWIYLPVEEKATLDMAGIYEKKAGIYAVGKKHGCLARGVEFDLINKNGEWLEYHSHQHAIDGYFINPIKGKIQRISPAVAEKFIGAEGMKKVREKMSQILELPNDKYILDKLFPNKV